MHQHQKGSSNTVNYWFNEVCSSIFFYFFAIPFGATRGAELTRFTFNKPLKHRQTTFCIPLTHTIFSLFHLPQAFTIMDQNRDGFIDKNDLRDTFAALGGLVISAIRHCRSALVDEALSDLWPLPPQAVWTSNKRSSTRCYRRLQDPLTSPSSSPCLGRSLKVNGGVKW